MKKIVTVCLAALLLLAALTGCQTPAPTPDAIRTEGESVQPTQTAPETEAAAQTDPTQPAGEPADWEEEWPEEFPVETYRLEGDVFAQTGTLYRYRYAQLPGAEHYQELLRDYVTQVLGTEVDMQQDSPHDGYANWFLSAGNNFASISGSDITGRFTFRLNPGFDRVEPMLEQTVTDRAALEEAAADFVARFADITGPVVFAGSEVRTAHYQDERASDWQEVVVPVLRCTFHAQAGSLSLPIQDGLPVPVTCGDSEIGDLAVPSFAVELWPDGTVVGADNYITQAEAELAASVRMLDESDVPQLLTYLTSLVENDTVVFHSIRASELSVYFGSADVEPTLTVEYYYASDPDDLRSTLFVLPGLFD